ncbi:hypothetical protein ABTN76_19425, partial [Acinetobacter baumannii]
PLKAFHPALNGRRSIGTAAVLRGLRHIQQGAGPGSGLGTSDERRLEGAADDEIIQQHTVIIGTVLPTMMVLGAGTRQASDGVGEPVWKTVPTAK